MPILDAILSHLRHNKGSYHVPGHKLGRGLPGELGSWLGAAGRLDLTEIPGLDDLHAPEGAILKAQELAAKAFGAEESYFLVNGSTAGNIAMIMAAVRPSEKILVPRNLHKSVLNGLILAQARPVYYRPDVDERHGIASGVDPETVRDAVRAHPDAKAVLVVSPTYHGICSDLRALAEVVHEAGMLLLVDEAHGAHFAFHEDLPPTAMESGADAAVQSTHKTLGSLTQSSMLHVQGTRLDRVRLKKRLQLIQSTSPSYLLLAALDAARWQMQTEGRDKLHTALQAVRAGAERLRQEAPQLQLLTEAGAYRVDPLKWTISTAGLGLTGVQAYEHLHAEQRMTLELADPRNVLAVFTYADEARQVERLVDALLRLQPAAEEGVNAMGLEGLQPAAERAERPDGTTSSTPQGETTNSPAAADGGLMSAKRVMPEQRMLPHEAFESEAESIPLENCIGRIAAEMVIPYPPGIPLLVPGEVWSQELVDEVRRLRTAGVRFQGVEDARVEQVYVLKGV